MAQTTRPGRGRPGRWPDVVITLALVALLIGGLAALWGDELRRLAGGAGGGGAGAPAAAPTPGPAAPTGAT
ncbi:MAG: hypothetical protein KBG28_13215 [Kofleriaceae bacterium]|jgi:hypothetical protein|nr:hypothetical protein [Kofleriaceae bacterium]MBP6839300.1 hypothetical protein [Kofleriaceae bacterium]MBP9204924.1 hypothetical protein [Kofleriaceae bacterium]